MGKASDFISEAEFGEGKRPQRPLQEPGTFFEYNDVRINRLALSLLRVWKRPLPDVLQTEIMAPIGASNDWRWVPYNYAYADVDGKRMPTVSGGTRWGSGLWINTEGKMWAGVPASSFAAVGFGGNTVWVDPQDDLVVVWRWHKGNGAELFRQVVEAIRTEKPSVTK